MFKNVRVNWWVAGVLGAAAYALTTGSAKAEPPAYYSRTYVTTTQTVNYGPAYVPTQTVTYVEPAVTYVQPVYSRVVYPRPVYFGGYYGGFGGYYGPRYHRPYGGHHQHHYARPYYGGYGYRGGYGHHGGHRSWGFGVAGGHGGGGFGFHYSR